MTRAPQQPKETEANRVTQAAADLQYYPNHLARSLTTKRTGTVGMVVSDMSNPFFAEIIRGFEATLRPQQYNLIVCNTEDDRSREEEELRLLMGKRVDGIAAAVTSETWATLQAAQNRAFPLVFLDLKVEGVQGPLVCGDNDLGAYQGVSHLIADGHTRICILAGMPGMSSMQNRLSGYRRARSPSTDCPTTRPTSSSPAWISRTARDRWTPCWLKSRGQTRSSSATICSPWARCMRYNSRHCSARRISPCLASMTPRG